MSVKSMMFIFSGASPNSNALEAALSLSASWAASLRIVYLADQTLAPAAYAHSDNFATAGITQAQMVSSQNSELQRDAVEAAAHAVREVTARHGVSVAEVTETSDLVPESVTFQSVPDDHKTRLIRESRTVDLILTGYDHLANDDMNPLLTALFHSGRPVISIPRMAGRALAKGAPASIAIAWDGGLSASRAVREALPLLRQAKQVRVITVRSRGDDTGDQQILAYLRLHGVTAELDLLKPDGHSVGAALLEQTSAFGADLLVMGAYGHGHLAEMVLGGVTNHIVKHSQVPLFLVHG